MTKASEDDLQEALEAMLSAGPDFVLGCKTHCFYCLEAQGRMHLDNCAWANAYRITMGHEFEGEIGSIKYPDPDDDSWLFDPQVIKDEDE